MRPRQSDFIIPSEMSDSDGAVVILVSDVVVVMPTTFTSQLHRSEESSQGFWLSAYVLCKVTHSPRHDD